MGETDGYQSGISARPCAVPRALSEIPIQALADPRIGADYRAIVAGALVGDLVGSYLPGCGPMVAPPPHGRSDRMRPNELQRHDTVDIEIDVEQWLSAPRLAIQYGLAAARARTLQAAATTPRLKQYLGEMIARYERRAEEVEGI